MPRAQSIALSFHRPTRHVFGVLLLTVLLTAGCGSEPAVSRQSTFHLEIGAVALDAQLAIDSATQQKGLMYRESLEENQGMLFISEKPGPQSYWMRNTMIPLDIGFFTEDGVLREIYPLFPRVEDPVKSRRNDIAYALEMNRGWYKANGVKVGDQLDLELVDQARRALATAR